MSVITELLYNTFEIVKSECSSHDKCEGCRFLEGNTCSFAMNPEHWNCDKIKNICYDIHYR